MTEDNLTRRTALQTMAVGASVALAGCSSGGSSDDGNGGNGNSGDENGGDGNGGDGGGNGGDGGDGNGGGSTDFGGWFGNTSNFDGVVDETGSDEVTVEVGASGNGGNFAFSPAAVTVSSGTTVVWEWTGKGAMHDVVADDGDFESEQTNEEGHTFEHTFDSAGTYRYYCTPHETMGMKGAIVVE